MTGQLKGKQQIFILKRWFDEIFLIKTADMSTGSSLVLFVI